MHKHLAIGVSMKGNLRDSRKLIVCVVIYRYSPNFRFFWALLQKIYYLFDVHKAPL